MLVLLITQQWTWWSTEVWPLSAPKDQKIAQNTVGIFLCWHILCADVPYSWLYCTAAQVIYEGGVNQAFHIGGQDMCPAHNGHAEYKSLAPWDARLPIIMKLRNWKLDPGQRNHAAGIMFTSLLRLYLLSIYRYIDISTSCRYPPWCGIVRYLSVSNPPSPIPSLFKDLVCQILSSIIIPTLFLCHYLSVSNPVPRVQASVSY